MSSGGTLPAALFSYSCDRYAAYGEAHVPSLTGQRLSALRNQRPFASKELRLYREAQVEQELLCGDTRFDPTSAVRGSTTGYRKGRTGKHSSPLTFYVRGSTPERGSNVPGSTDLRGKHVPESTDLRGKHVPESTNERGFRDSVERSFKMGSAYREVQSARALFVLRSSRISATGVPGSTGNHKGYVRGNTIERFLYRKTQCITSHTQQTFLESGLVTVHCKRSCKFPLFSQVSIDLHVPSGTHHSPSPYTSTCLPVRKAVLSRTPL